MKVNGSLVFDASSASTIQNLRLEKVSALPTAVAADVGRLIYNTTTSVIYVGVDAGGYTWTPLATGGDASALLSEVDRIETALGLNADGSFNAAAFTGNLAGQASYVALITTLQGLVASNASGLAAEITRATDAETALGVRIDDVEGDLAAEVTRATGAEGALQTAIDDEEAARAAADTAIRTDFAAADATNAAAITAEQTRATTAEGLLSDRIDDEHDHHVAGDAANATAIAAEETRATAAEGALDGRITQEVADRTAAVNTVATNLATEISDRTAADTAQSTALTNEINRATAQEAAIRGEIASALVGLSWEAPIDLIATDAAANAADKPDGYRIVDTTLNQIFTVTGGAVGTGEALVDGAAFFNRTNDIGYTFNGTAVVPFSGAASFVAGAGLSMSGNTVNVGNSDGSITITADEIAVSAAVRTEITDNASAIAAETTRATTAEAGLDDRIDDEIAAREAAITAEAAARTAADTAITTAFQAADSTINTRIDTLQGELDAAELAFAAADDVVRDEFAAADTALGDRIDDEAAARATAITTVTDLVTAEETRAIAREDEIGSLLAETRMQIYNAYFVYDSTPAATPELTTHVVTHNLGAKYCNVTVIDANDEMVIPQSVTFNSDTQLTVTFNTAIACRVVVMGIAPFIV